MDATLFSSWIYREINPLANEIWMGHPARMKVIAPLCGAESIYSFEDKVADGAHGPQGGELRNAPCLIGKTNTSSEVAVTGIRPEAIEVHPR